MGLTEIEYGALASSEVVNNNFRYLDNRISGIAEVISSNNAAFNSNLATMSSSISTMNEDLNANIADIQERLDDSSDNFISLVSGGLYITTYRNSGSWYREYFADSDKTMRIWLEQGGLGNTLTTVNLLRSYQNAGYFVVAQRTSDTYEYPTIIKSITNTSFYVDCRAYGDATRYCTMRWYTCGC